MPPVTARVRSGSKADIVCHSGHVRKVPKAGFKRLRDRQHRGWSDCGNCTDLRSTRHNRIGSDGAKTDP